MIDVSKAAAGKISSFVGYTLGLFSIIGFIVEITEKDNSDRTFGIVLSMVFLLISALFIIVGAGIKTRIKRFWIYSGILSNNNATPVSELAAAVSKPSEFVIQDLQYMIGKRLYKNVRMDIRTNSVINDNPAAQTQAVNPPHAETVSIKCEGCGAVNSKQEGMAGVCEYCGSPIK